MFFSKRRNVAEPERNSGAGLPIGRILTKMGKVTPAQVMEALTLQKTGGGKLGEVLVQLGYVTPEDVSAALAAQRGDGADG